MKNCLYTKYSIGDLVRIKTYYGNIIDLYIDGIVFSHTDSGYKYYYQSNLLPDYGFEDNEIICLVMEEKKNGKI